MTKGLFTSRTYNLKLPRHSCYLFSMPTERLQKIMAAAGIASRRKAEEYIAAGRVTLNGKIVREQGPNPDPQFDKFCLDANPLTPATHLLYFMLKKPKGYVTTVSDPEGR